MIYIFENYSLDPDRRELRRETDLIAVEPQVFDLLLYLIRSRDRVVSKDDMITAVWNGRIVSESALTSRLTATRHAIGDSGEKQRLIRTIPRKGLRFVGEVREEHRSGDAYSATPAPPREPEKAASPSRAEPSNPGRRQITIMVCDVIGSAALSGRLDPEDLREVTTSCHGCVRELVEGHGGFVAKYMAQGILVYFGYPQAHEDDAERAVRAGLAAIRAVAELKIEGLAKPLQARVGIATGLVVVGDSIGADATSEHVLVGETPHLAARLLELTAPGAVVISTGTRRLIGDLFDYRDLGAVKFTIAESVEATEVLRESSIESRFEALRSDRTQLIGRDEELDLLLRRWNQTKTGEGRVVLVWGEPGIGKSRLAAALRDAVKGERHACLRFYCSPHRAQTALHPIVHHLEHAAGFEPADSDGIRLDKLERLLAPASQEVNRDISLFADLLSISTGSRYTALSVSPQRRKELLLERFIAQLVGLAARQPVLMILEDAHWIDPTTRELFDIIIERVRNLPVLFMMTYRPEFVPPWLGQSHVTTLTLNRLGRRDNAVMVKQVAGGKELPRGLLDQIITRTDGVPLFIEEMTKTVLESGILSEEDDAYVLARPLPFLAVPATLQASLVARLDRLATVRAVVQTGAALGREFTYPVLKAVMKLPDADLQPLLNQLVASELVHQRGAVPHAFYTFKHALVQDAAHETLLKSQRTQLHSRITEVLEQEFPEAPLRNPDVLAYHCSEAGLWEKAIDYWLKAARMALDRSAGSEAHAQVEKGIALLPKIEDSLVRQQFEGRLQVALGDTLVMTKGFASPDVAATLTRARDLLDESIYPIEALRALCGLFNYHLMRSEAPKGLKLAEAFLKRPLDQLTSPVIEYLVGAAHLHIGNFKDARFRLENSLALYEEDACRPIAFIGGYHIRSFTLVWLGLAYLYSGSFDRARKTMSDAVEDARTRSHPFTLVSALLALARFLNHTRDFKRAVEATEEGFVIATDQRSPYHISRASVLRAVNLIAANQHKEGIALMEHALVAHRETGANYQSSYNLSNLAFAHAQVGNIELALEIASQAVVEVEQSGERWWEAEARRIRGEILLAAAPIHRDEAEACFQRGLECARRQEARFWELRAAQSLAKSWHARRRHAEAQQLLAPIHGAFSDGFDFPDLQDAKELLVRLDSPANCRITLSSN